MLKTTASTHSTSLAQLAQRAGAKIADAIQTASAKTGVDFSYLLQQAQVESSFKADAKAKSSSATGLFQFIDSTWLQMVNKYGDKYGLDDYASQITDKGKVLDKAMKNKILALRNDPHICSLMAGEFAAENKNYLQKCVGGDVGSTELYMAHFMGAGGAAKFLSAMKMNPDANAATAFPSAAAANKNVFYNKDGSAKSLKDVYAAFDKKFAIDPENVSCSKVAESKHTTTTTDMGSTNAQVAMAAPTYWPSLYTNTNVVDRSPSSADYYKSIGAFQSLISPVDLLEIMKTQTYNS